MRAQLFLVLVVMRLAGNASGDGMLPDLLKCVHPLN